MKLVISDGFAVNIRKNWGNPLAIVKKCLREFPLRQMNRSASETDYEHGLRLGVQLGVLLGRFGNEGPDDFLKALSEHFA